MKIDIDLKQISQKMKKSQKKIKRKRAQPNNTHARTHAQEKNRTKINRED